MRKINIFAVFLVIAIVLMSIFAVNSCIASDDLSFTTQKIELTFKTPYFSEYVIASHMQDIVDEVQSEYGVQVGGTINNIWSYTSGEDLMYITKAEISFFTPNTPAGAKEMLIHKIKDIAIPGTPIFEGSSDIRFKIHLE